MRCHLGYFLCACFCAVLIMLELWIRLTDHTCHQWISRSGYTGLDSSLQPVQIPLCNETLYQQPDDPDSCPVSLTVPRKRSAVGNVTLYITPRDLKLGQLGNRMFRYATMLGIARRQVRHLFVEPNTDLGQTFKLHYEGVNKDANKWPIIQQETVLSFDPKLMNLPLKNVRIDGNLQSYCYFAQIIDEIRQEFTFQDHVSAAAAKILHDVYVNYNSSMVVGVHARRGDFLERFWQDIGFRIPKKSYYMKAFSLMKSKFPGRKILFIVATNDYKWCSENLIGDDVILMPPASPAVHLAVLSRCEHVVMSCGTFGWWAAWLANGQVIYYAHFFGGGTVKQQVKANQYYPPLWIGLED